LDNLRDVLDGKDGTVKLLGFSVGKLLSPVRVRANGTQSIEPVAQFDQAQGRFVALPIDLGPETDQVFLVLFGTGLRFHGGLAGVSARLGGVEAPVLFAGAQGAAVGLDQVNLRVPRALAGRGEVELTLRVDGQEANPLRIRVK
jgi:uncharacterized protein (TIGR03437 family)